MKYLSSLAGYIPPSLASNIKAVEWLPQNDLLAHKDIKAFVSHVGHNSVYESAYHGVPIVAFPLFADQPVNAKKVEHNGYGLTVDYETGNAQQMTETIELVISEPRYLFSFFFDFSFLGKNLLKTGLSFYKPSTRSSSSIAGS